MAGWLRTLLNLDKPNDDPFDRKVSLDVIFYEGSDELPPCEAGPGANPSAHGIFTVLSVDKFYGVPGNLIINLVVFVGGVLLFSLLRKKAWNYGRLALLERVERAHYFAGRGQVDVAGVDDEVTMISRRGTVTGNSTQGSKYGSLTAEQSRTKWLKSKMFARYTIFVCRRTLKLLAGLNLFRAQKLNRNHYQHFLSINGSPLRQIKIYNNS